MKQIVYGKLYVDVRLKCLDGVHGFLVGSTLISQGIGVQYHNGFTERDIQGIDHCNLSVGILFQKFSCHHTYVVVASAQGGGESDVNDIKSLLQKSAEFFFDHGGIICLGTGQFTLFHAFVKFGWRHVELIAVNSVSERVILRDDCRVQLFDVFLRKV